MTRMHMGTPFLSRPSRQSSCVQPAARPSITIGQRQSVDLFGLLVKALCAAFAGAHVFRQRSAAGCCAFRCLPGDHAGDVNPDAAAPLNL
jgi:hypothetical protein